MIGIDDIIMIGMALAQLGQAGYGAATSGKRKKEARRSSALGLSNDYVYSQQPINWFDVANRGLQSANSMMGIYNRLKPVQTTDHNYMKYLQISQLLGGGGQ